MRPYQPPVGGQIRDAVREQQGKGKGRATGDDAAPAIVADPSQRKLERGYAYLVRDVPSPSSIAAASLTVPGRKTGVKAQHFMRLIQDPELQPVTIAPLPDEAIRDAFSLQAGQIEGVRLGSSSTELTRTARPEHLDDRRGSTCESRAPCARRCSSDVSAAQEATA